MKKTKAAFRALRESCGLTQQDLADAVGVHITSIKKWENPNSHLKEIPDDVWDFLVTEFNSQAEEAERAFQALVKLIESNEPIAVRYYRTQEELDDAQKDLGLSRNFRCVNAITLKVVNKLKDVGIEFDIFYPDQMEIIEPQRY